MGRGALVSIEGIHPEKIGCRRCQTCRIKGRAGSRSYNNTAQGRSAHGIRRSVNGCRRWRVGCRANHKVAAWRSCSGSKGTRYRCRCRSKVKRCRLVGRCNGRTAGYQRYFINRTRRLYATRAVVRPHEHNTLGRTSIRSRQTDRLRLIVCLKVQVGRRTQYRGAGISSWYVQPALESASGAVEHRGGRSRARKYRNVVPAGLTLCLPFESKGDVWLAGGEGYIPVKMYGRSYRIIVIVGSTGYIA